MTGKSRLTLLTAGLMTLLGVGCTAGPKHVATLAAAPRVVPPPSELPTQVPLYRVPPYRPPAIAEPKFDPIQDVIDRAEAAFSQGEKSYAAGHLESAKEEFDRAVGLLLQSPVTPREDRRLQKTFDSLVDRIHAYELMALRQGDGFAEQLYQPAPKDDLQTLTFPENPQLTEQVRQEAAKTVSAIPLVVNDQVANFLQYFTVGRGRATLEAALQRSGRFRDMILKILAEEQVPQELISLAQAESGFQPRARSEASALGLWQFIASRGKEYGLDRSWWVDERMNPEQATRAAARHLRDLYNEFGDWYLAMAAYNCGPVCVQRAVERTGYADFWELSRRKVLPAQTRNYVPIIVALMIIEKNPDKYGISDLPREPSWTYDTVTVNSPIDLRLVAEIVGTNVETIRELNPDLLRSTTPKVPEYTLRIPAATRETFLKRVAMIPPEKRVFWRWHEVNYGETLSSIARQYRTSVKAIAEVNNLDPSKPLVEATELVIPVGNASTVADLEPPSTRPGDRHTVARNETLASIARRYRVSVAQLMEWNHLTGSSIRVGQKLIVRPEIEGSEPPRPAVRRVASTAAPAAARRTAGTLAKSAPKPSTGKMVHRVVKGDSLFGIAAAYNTSVEALRRYNRHLGRTLQIGDSVYIPTN